MPPLLLFIKSMGIGSLCCVEKPVTSPLTPLQEHFHVRAFYFLWTKHEETDNSSSSLPILWKSYHTPRNMEKSIGPSGYFNQIKKLGNKHLSCLEFLKKLFLTKKKVYTTLCLWTSAYS